MPKILLTFVGAAAVAAALVVPASAQRATTSQSWEGASWEMQRRGPRSSMHGPLSDGRIVVTPGYGYGKRYMKRAKPRYYGMGR
jgi:hypothetical protein